jgi:transcriptional regulator of arginine metabolism
MTPGIAERLNYMRKILGKGENSTQEELRESLEKAGFEVNQSTISRDLRKIGVIKFVDQNGQTAYKLADQEVEKNVITQSLITLVKDISHNGSLIVLSTSPGSASLIARHLDLIKLNGILGTIAGDDTIFIAPRKCTEIKKVIRDIQDSLT